MNRVLFASVCVGLALSYGTAAIAEDEVGITADLMSIKVVHDGASVSIIRNQNSDAMVPPDFALTSRPCPPFCIQPGQISGGVETIGELELINYLDKIASGDESVMVIDSRTADWVKRSTIPGSVNISWAQFNTELGATTKSITEILTNTFGAKLPTDLDMFELDEAIANGKASEIFDYSGAKTLVKFCNGIWCGQSPTAINTLRRFGYPDEKLKWYRGGMQNWHNVGLTAVGTESHWD